MKISASNDLELFYRAAAYKRLYYRTVWVHYEQAIKGTLRLIPSLSILKILEKDYKKMQAMFYDKEVKWDLLMLQQIRSRLINCEYK